MFLIVCKLEGGMGKEDYEVTDYENFVNMNCIEPRKSCKTLLKL